MPPFLYPPPATALLSFTDLCVDPSSKHTVILADATQARSRLRNALKDVEARSGGGGGNASGDWLLVLDAVQGYLPFLLGTINSLEADDLLERNEPLFPWKSTIAASPPGIASPALRSLPSFGAELVMSLTTYALALANLAHGTVRDPLSAAAGAGERRRITSAADDKRQVDRLAQGADMLCRASGVFEYIALRVLPAWEARIADSTMDASRAGFRLGKGRDRGRARMPAEFSRDVQRALAMLALADANAIGIEKLLAPFHVNTTFHTTTLPLPRGHPSPGLVAKLHIEVASLYASARNLLKTLKNAPPALEGLNIDDELEPRLMAYLRKEWGLAEVRSRKWLAVEAGEHASGDKVGQAIAMLKDAQARLDELRKHGDIGASTMKKVKGFGAKFGGAKEERTEQRGRMEREMADIEAFLKTYTHMNNTVSFQPIPPSSAVQALMPGGRPVLSSKQFTPPAPAFGPGSSSYIPTTVKRPLASAAGQDSPSIQAQTADTGTYAGAGNYF
ncbi:hypothetical protein NCC49_001709 [Naganishia albida]|nr:hypothetical protein NCC49_001709 [Naganishia albida]